MTTSPAWVPMSPLTIYHFEIKPLVGGGQEFNVRTGQPPSVAAGGATGDDTSIVESFYQFQWYGFGSDCKASLVCSPLSGNICGSYGVTATYSSTTVNAPPSSTQAVCHEGRYYLGTLGFLELLTIGFWQHKDAEAFYGQCYLWCSQDGNPPRKPTNTGNAEEVIAAIVSCVPDCLYITTSHRHPKFPGRQFFE